MHPEGSTLLLTRRPLSCGTPSGAHPPQHRGWKWCGLPLWATENKQVRGWLRVGNGWSGAQTGASPPVSIGGSSIVEGGATFTVGLVDACPSGHQRHSALVAPIGSCIVQGGPGNREKANQGENTKAALTLQSDQLPQGSLPLLRCSQHTHARSHTCRIYLSSSGQLHYSTAN